MRKDHIAQLYRRTSTTQHRANFRARRQTRNERQRSAGKTSRLHASGESVCTIATGICKNVKITIAAANSRVSFDLFLFSSFSNGAVDKSKTYK